MSYGAERWAREKCLDFKGDQTALAVLKEIAYWFLDDEMICKDVSQGDLAKLLGLKRQQTVADALKRLADMGLVKSRKVIDETTGNVMGTNFYLPSYVPSEWPVSRQGKAVFLRKARSSRVTEEVAKADDCGSTDLCGQTDLCGLTEEGMRFGRGGVCGLTEEGYAVKPQTYTGNKQGLTGNKHISVETPSSPAEADDQNTQGVLFSEEKKAINAPAEKVPRPKNAFPPCPYQKIVELYHEKLPMFPRVAKLTTSRRTAINARWKDVCEEIRRDGLQVTEAAALENFVCFFDLVLRDDFLMGRTPRGERYANWRCTLDYLMTPKGFFKLIEKYR